MKHKIGDACMKIVMLKYILPLEYPLDHIFLNHVTV
jgi:hypothetical protein